MWFTHEQVPMHEDAPSPEQLFRLAARGAVIAKRHQKMRTYAQAKNPRSHFMMPPAEVIFPSEDEAPEGFCYERKFSASVARTGFRSWSMRLLSTYIVTKDGIENGAERHTYSFDWDMQHTTLAHHSLHIMPAVEQDVADMVEHFQVRDDLASEWGLRMQMQQVTAGDVELLTNEVSTFTGQSYWGNGTIGTGDAA